MQEIKIQALLMYHQEYSLEKNLDPNSTQRVQDTIIQYLNSWLELINQITAQHHLLAQVRYLMLTENTN